MFDTYAEIFAQRAASYHKAMEDVPNARRHEFLLAARYLQVDAGQVICDVPAGGGYLKRFIDVEPVGFRFLETSEDFARECSSDDNCRTQLCTFDHLPLQPNSVDRVLSLAALHHVEDPGSFFREIRRIISPDGQVVIADVQEHSPPDGFLNVFVDRHNSMGHRGRFLRQSTTEQLRASGFTIDLMNAEQYPWIFGSEDEMVAFCRDLFGLDQATDPEILRGIEQYLGYSAEAQTIRMNWELTFIRARPNRAGV